MEWVRQSPFLRRIGIGLVPFELLSRGPLLLLLQSVTLLPVVVFWRALGPGLDCVVVLGRRARPVHCLPSEG